MQAECIAARRINCDGTASAGSHSRRDDTGRMSLLAEWPAVEADGEGIEMGSKRLLRNNILLTIFSAGIAPTVYACLRSLPFVSFRRLPLE